MLNEIVLSELQRLRKQHVFDKATLAASALAENQHWLLRSQKKLHHVIVPYSVVRGHVKILHDSHARDLLLEVNLHT